MDELKAPEKIYIQLNPDDPTWCDARILESDIEYARTPSLPYPCTVEQWEEITGETFPDNGLVWYKDIRHASIPEEESTPAYYENCKNDKIANIYIVQTAKPAPEEGRRE